MNSQRDGYNDGSDQTAGDECQNLVRTLNVVPEGGQGADLRASETDTSLALSSLNGQAHDRVSLAASRSGVRRLTPVECERLQGLPDGWTTPGSDSKRYAGLGDAVTANVAEWIGRRILQTPDQKSGSHDHEKWSPHTVTRTGRRGE